MFFFNSGCAPWWASDQSSREGSIELHQTFLQRYVVQNVMCEEITKGANERSWGLEQDEIGPQVGWVLRESIRVNIDC